MEGSCFWHNDYLNLYINYHHLYFYINYNELKVMSSQSAKINGTHRSKIKGSLTNRTEYPTDSGPEGLQEGDMFYNSGNNSVVVRTSSEFRLGQMTTTSTTTS